MGKLCAFEVVVLNDLERGRTAIAGAVELSVHVGVASELWRAVLGHVEGCGNHVDRRSKVTVI
jgi:hypothetical protein